VAKLTHEQERLHAQACQLVNLARDLTEEERAFVLDHWRASSTARNASDRAHFTPAGLAGEMALHVDGDRIIDLAAGIGHLAFHCRNRGGRWPHGDPEFVCVERNPEYVRVGRRVMPDARWICADIMSLPAMRDDLGDFDFCVSNPPYGALPRMVAETGGYRGRRFEYHTIALAATVARKGVFLIPQHAAPFQYSGLRPHLRYDADAEYRKFVERTGIELKPSCGVNTFLYRHAWHDVSPLAEIVRADFTERASTASSAEQQGRLALLSR